ncbi:MULTISPECIES: TRAP transporter large permease [unclassified Sporosarcina]|uniref:TRAP transporter large permease n=1 Tax=unclassified Sporosarcina TaxID=2647733 RepID=UPI0020419C53|nr:MULTISPECIES: TRAP transporter large permease subunit [unclassified Sporosarcina]GKV64005.1 C4-dicarboxylate ABC transporter permease [Sporosarcina sp. NCCP-2331]GLB54786.1 C4-dicarboxylate ABC transporter permease [Sporosarcina sp. NCCP-2378]
MSLAVVSITLIGLLVLFLGSTIWVGVSLFLVGIGGLMFFTSSPPMTIMNNILWNNTNSSTMLALPLFILMGEILFRSKISENLFKGLTPWISFLPGRLIHVNIAASSLFAAVSGSSAATTATVGKITLPELSKRNYDRSLSLGSLAGAGTLGFLIPPSMMMIVYGIVADVSIGKLFIAGIVPGIILAAGLSGYIIIRCLINPSLAVGDEKYSWAYRFQTLPLILPVIVLIVLVLGSIYSGWATPTEAASVGVAGSLVFALFSRTLTISIFKEVLLATVKTSTMIMLIVAGASYLSVVVGYLNMPAKLTAFISEMGLSSYMLIVILTIMYIILGCLLDGFSMIVMTMPLALPLIVAAGFDPLWFGIYLIFMIEVAQITPPVGFNLFVINGMVEEDILTIAKYALPSFLIILLIVAVVTVFPEIILWLPNKM